MSRFLLATVVRILAALCLMAVDDSFSVAADQLPNVLFIIADDLNRHLPC